LRGKDENTYYSDHPSIYVCLYSDRLTAQADMEVEARKLVLADASRRREVEAAKLTFGLPSPNPPKFSFPATSTDPPSYFSSFQVPSGSQPAFTGSFGLPTGFSFFKK
jgi:hypothetical protein